MAKKPKPEGKKYNYMDTYGDLVTLLLCFFVLLFSMSTVEEEKYNTFVEALSQRFGAAQLNYSTAERTDGEDYGDDDPQGEIIPPEEIMPSDLSAMSEQIADYIEEMSLQEFMEIYSNEDNSAIYIRMSDELMFNPDSYVIRPQAMPHVRKLGELFKANEETIFMITFRGHTASVLNNNSNVDSFMLSGDRASNIASFMMNDMEFNRFKLMATGYGRNYPIADNSTAEGRAKNRRVDIVIVSNDTEDPVKAFMESMRVYFPDDERSFMEEAPDEIVDDIIDKAFPDTEMNEVG